MLDLRIEISPAAIDEMKLRLTRALPDVKSSHRVEGLARGLGFRTYAAMRAQALTPACSPSANATGFCGYLAEHGYSIDGIHFYRAVGAAAITQVMEREPQLSHWGYHVGPPKRRPDGKWESAVEHQDRFRSERELLKSDAVVDEFLLSLGLVQRIVPTKTIRGGTGSYRLKHVAEKSSCRLPCGAEIQPHYVANGTLIAAAIHAGFYYKTHADARGYDGVNVTFNMSKAAVDDLDRTIRGRAD